MQNEGGNEQTETQTTQEYNVELLKESSEQGKYFIY